MIDTSLAPSTRTPHEARRADRALAIYVEHSERIAGSYHAGAYKVPSCSGSAEYTVRLTPKPYCSCPDFRKSGAGDLLCKHVMAAQVVRKTTAPCSGCGRRFRHRDLAPVEPTHLTFFEGDQLCSSCSCAHGLD